MKYCCLTIVIITSYSCHGARAAETCFNVASDREICEWQTGCDAMDETVEHFGPTNVKCVPRDVLIRVIC